MRRWLALLLVALVAAGAAGCGGEKEKGINSGKDKPKAVD